MCFSKTFNVFEIIETTIKEEMPFPVYQKGCFWIAHAAATILQRLGHNAHVKIVALWKRLTGKWIPHAVVMVDGDLMDFKMRVFGIMPGPIECREPIGAVAHDILQLIEDYAERTVAEDV